MSRRNTNSSQEEGVVEDFSKQIFDNYESILDHSPQNQSYDYGSDIKMRIIQIIQTRSFEDNQSDLSLILSELDKFEHFNSIKNEEGYQDLLKEFLDHLEYEYIPKGKFLFHYGDIGEKIYFIAKGQVSIHVPRPNKEIFKQEKNYQLRKYWEDQIDKQDISANERETAKVNYQRAREKILKYLEKYQHTSFYKQLINGHPSNKKIMKKYFHEQYKTFGLFQKVNDLKDGQSFGEVAMISRKLRTASVFAEEDLHLFYMRGKDYLNIFEQHLYKLNFVLKNVEKYFENLSKKQILDLSYLFDAFEHTIHLNQIIFKEGSDRQYIYLIKSGSIAFKSSRGISLGIISEGEFFGFENKKGEDSSLFNEKHQINAISITNGTVVYRLKVQLLQDDGYKQIVKEFSQKGSVKAEYYAKRAQHCQNIFEQTEASNPYHQELANYNDFGQSPKASQKLSDSPFISSKNIKKLMNKLQIQKKFQKYIEENQNSNSPQISDRSRQSEQNEGRKSFSQRVVQISGSMTERINSNKQNQIVSFGSSIQLIENNTDSKMVQSNPNLVSRSSKTRLSINRNQSQINDNSVNRSSQMLSSQKIQIPSHISNQINENEISINSFLTADQINSLNFSTQFKQKSELNVSQSVPRISVSQSQKLNEGVDSKFQFISKDEFEQTKQNIIKEQEKLRAKKSQHFMPQELADMSLCKKISLKYLSSSQQHLTPQQHKPQITLSNFFHHSSSSLRMQPPANSPLRNSIEQPSCSLLKTSSNFACTPLKASTELPNSPPILSSNQEITLNKFQFKYPISPEQEQSKCEFSPPKILLEQQQSQQTASSPEGQQYTFFPSQDVIKSQVTPSQTGRIYGQKRRLTSVSPINQKHSVDYIVEQNNKQESRRSCIGLMVSSSKITNNVQENKNDQNSEKKNVEDALILTPQTSSQSHNTHLQSPITLKQKISNFSYSSFSSYQQKIMMNSSCKNSQQSSQIMSSSPISSNQTKSPSEKYNLESNQDVNLLTNYAIPSTFSYTSRYSKDEIIQNTPFNKQKHQKSSLSRTNSIFQDVSALKESFNQYKKQCNQLQDNKVKNNLAITDLNNPQNNRPSITSITLKSFSDFNLNTARNTLNNQNSPRMQSSHHRSFSQIQNSTHEQQLTSRKELKNRQYSQLFKKSNESKSLKKKQKMMPLLANESDNNLNSSNNIQSKQPSPKQFSNLCINASQTLGNGFSQDGFKSRVQSFLMQQSLNNFQQLSSNALSQKLIQGDALINSNSQNKKKQFRNGSILLPITSNLLQSNQASKIYRKKSLPYCSVKSIFEGCKEINPCIEPGLMQTNILIKNN